MNAEQPTLELALADYPQLFHALAEPAFLVDPEQGRILDTSDAAARMLQFSREELLKLSIADIHPFEMDRFNAFAREVLENGHGRARGMTCRCREGVFIPAEISASRVYVGDRTCILAQVRDLREEPAAIIGEPVALTEYRDLQERLARTEYLLDHAPEMVLWVTPEGRVIYANQTAAEVLGILRSDLQRMWIWDIDSELCAEEFPGYVERFRKQGRISMEREMCGADGSSFPVTVTVQLIRHGDREIIVSFSRNISKEVRARDDARRYLGELARVSRQSSVSEMASAVSHEINQPLTAMLTRSSTCLRLLAKDAPDLDRVREGLDAIHDSAERIREVIERLRAYMKGGESVRAPTPTAELLEQCATLIRAEARHRGMELTLVGMDDLPVVDVDPILIQQVIINLARNGMDAMVGTETARRGLSIEAYRGSDGGLVVDVHDSGCGVDPGAVGRVFEPFFSTKGSGLGIGLSLCRSIVDSHGGALTLASTSPDGSTFRMTLPASAPGGAGRTAID